MIGSGATTKKLNKIKMWREFIIISAAVANAYIHIQYTYIHTQHNVVTTPTMMKKLLHLHFLLLFSLFPYDKRAHIEKKQKDREGPKNVCIQ